MADETDNTIEVAEDVEIEVVADEDGELVGAVVDDVIVATGPGGSIVDETIDVLDADGEVVVEDEIVSVYDEDGELVERDEVIAVLED